MVLPRQDSDAFLKRQWQQDMDQRLQETHRDEPLGLKDNPQEEKWFVELYGKKLQLKHEDYQVLLRKEVELKKKLKAANTLTGRISQWATTLGGATLGGVADLVVHLPSLGISLLMVPPGTFTALGTAIGRVVKGKSPDQIAYELHEIQSQREEAGAYLSNLEKGRREVGAHRKAKAPPPEPKRQYKPRRRRVEGFDVTG